MSLSAVVFRDGLGCRAYRTLLRGFELKCDGISDRKNAALMSSGETGWYARRFAPVIWVSSALRSRRAKGLAREISYAFKLSWLITCNRICTKLKQLDS